MDETSEKPEVVIDILSESVILSFNNQNYIKSKITIPFETVMEWASKIKGDHPDG